MKKLIWVSLLLGYSGLLWVPPTLAISLDFVPSFQTIGLGGTAAVDVVISGLGAGVPPSVGGFHLAVSFDPAVLLADPAVHPATGVRFGPFLGDLMIPEAVTDMIFALGLVDFAETSLLLPPALDALQPASFTLATLVFSTAPPAMIGDESPLLFALVDVVDAFGDPLVVVSGSGLVRVVPEPATFFLLGVGVAGIAILGRKHLFRKA